jgi:hypothetical protein
LAVLVGARCIVPGKRTWRDVRRQPRTNGPPRTLAVAYATRPAALVAPTSCRRLSARQPSANSPAGSRRYKSITLRCHSERSPRSPGVEAHAECGSLLPPFAARARPCVLPAPTTPPRL